MPIREHHIHTVKAVCSKCEQKAYVQESHIDRKHKVCRREGELSRTRMIVSVPSMAWTYGATKRSPLFGRTPAGEAVRIYRPQLKGDRTDHGKWVRA